MRLDDPLRDREPEADPAPVVRVGLPEVQLRIRDRPATSGQHPARQQEIEGATEAIKVGADVGSALVVKLLSFDLSLLVPICMVVGTALSDALTGPSATDKIPIVFPGQGNAGAVDGTKFPYAFPGSPNYPHQASAAVQFLMDEWKAAGKAGGPRIVCLGWEPPPGQEYCASVKKLDVHTPV